MRAGASAVLLPLNWLQSYFSPCFDAHNNCRESCLGPWLPSLRLNAVSYKGGVHLTPGHMVYKEILQYICILNQTEAHLHRLNPLSNHLFSMKVIYLSLFSLQALGSHAQEACDAACQVSFQQALKAESASWVSKNVSADEFYSTPANATHAKPGDLLRWEDVSRAVVNQNFTPPGGMSISRFLYMTEDIDRKPIPASAFVLLPYKKPDPTKPLDTLVWTHGTAGRIRNCAPSNHKDLYYEWQGPYALAQAGYAVVAPDYAGQGSDIPQGFMYESGFLHAGDVAYGLIAARKVLGDLLSKEYVVIGHSEGGMTAWRTNERLAMPDQAELLKAGTFLGSVAISPALRPLDLIPESIRRANGGPIGDAVSVFFLQSLALLFPDTFRLQDYVTDMVLGRIPLMDQGCLGVGRALFSNLSSEQLFKNTSWLEHPSVVDWQKRYNGAGPHALAAPMLVIQGVTDPLTYADNTESDFNRTCSAFPDSKATLVLYPGADHNLAPPASQQDCLVWIQERFDGVEVSKGCHIESVEPITTNFRDVGAYYSGLNG
jgi:pimeloyl-ACP methyl ester carboxylesterase